MSGEFNTIEEILGDLSAGKMVVIMDDADRENEGDLLMAAQAVRPDDINYMARFGRGLICLTLTRERCRQLRLPLMVSETDRNHGTNFTMSIEAAEGVTTGISAHDRAHTVQTAVAAGASAEDLRQPGHIFPLMAQPGGVLTRAGHTEAGCDLARLAGMEAAAVIVEILKDDGSMARRDDLFAFAREHDLKIASIAQLIRYRLDHEDSVEIIRDVKVATVHGEFRMVCFEDHINRTVHLALVHGAIPDDRPVLVRVHLQNTMSDVVGADWSSLGRPVDSAMRRIVEEGGGVVVVLRQHEDPSELIQIIDEGVQPDAHQEDSADEVLRTYGIGAQILCKLGVTKMRVLSAPKKMHGISGFGLEIVEYVE